MKKLMLALLLLVTGCASSEKTLKVAASAVPHAEILQIVEPELNEQGVRLKIVEVDDYTIPNRLLVEKQVDANYFQHRPFMDDQVNRFGYDIEELTKVHLEPLAIYSLKISSLDQVESGAHVAIPSDPTNEARALKLLQDVGLIELRAVKEGAYPTILDITANPKRLKIDELDAPFLPRALKDITLAVIPVNFALQGNLNPKDALATEAADSPYANIISIRKGDGDREEIILLKESLNSPKVKQFIEQKYHGELQPAF